MVRQTLYYIRTVITVLQVAVFQHIQLLLRQGNENEKTITVLIYLGFKWAILTRRHPHLKRVEVDDSNVVKDRNCDVNEGQETVIEVKQTHEKQGSSHVPL